MVQLNTIQFIRNTEGKFCSFGLLTFLIIFVIFILHFYLFPLLSLRISHFYSLSPADKYFLWVSQKYFTRYQNRTGLYEIQIQNQSKFPIQIRKVVKIQKQSIHLEVYLENSPGVVDRSSDQARIYAVCYAERHYLLLGEFGNGICIESGEDFPADGRFPGE